MSLQFKLRIGEKGEVFTPGIDFGPLKYVERNGDFIVLKNSGHKYWGGIGRPQNYAPAKFMVVEIEEYLEDGWYLVRQAVSFAARS